MSKKVRVGMVGAGGIISCGHLPSAKNIAEVEVPCLCDVDANRVEEKIKQFTVPRGYTDYEKMFSKEELDAVVIGLPNYLHKPVTIAALKAGLHVLVEKPMGRNAKECQEMINVAKQNKRILKVGHHMRFATETQILKKYIISGKLGELYYAKCSYLRRRGIPAGFNCWFTQKAQSGGGPLIDVGVHILDLTLWLLGHPQPVSVLAATYTKFGNRKDYYTGMWGFDPKKFNYDVEDLACAMIRFANGTSVLFDTSWASNIKEDRNYCQLFGTDGGAEWQPLRIYQETDHILVDVTPVVNIQPENPLQLRSFIECIKTNDKDTTQPICSAEQGMMVMKIIDAIYESQKRGKEIKIG